MAFAIIFISFVLELVANTKKNMKLFVAVTFLFAAVCAAPYDQPELGYPLRDMYAYMKCVPEQADESTKIHGCQDIWEEYRQDYLDMVTDFEDCTKRPTENEADA